MPSRPETPTTRSREARRKSLRSSGVFRAIGPILHTPQKHYPKHVLPLDMEESKSRLEAMADGFEELSENIAELANVHNSVNSFNESFASFLYGLLITMYRTNLPGMPTREQYEAIETRRENQEELSALKKQLSASKSRNDQLREQIEHKRTAESRPKSHLSELFLQTPAHRQKPPSSRSSIPIPTGKKVHVARDDSFLSTDSFIDVPGSKAQATRATEAAPGVNPNLDQAPRYMRGLFEIPNASNLQKNLTNKEKSQYKVGKPTGMKAPLRATTARRREQNLNSQRSRVETSKSSSQRAGSAAAQRAQRARENRLASRPPFR